MNGIYQVFTTVVGVKVIRLQCRMSQTCISSTDHVKRDFGRNNDRHNTETAQMEFICVFVGSAIQFRSSIGVDLSFKMRCLHFQPR